LKLMLETVDLPALLLQLLETLVPDRIPVGIPVEDLEAVLVTTREQIQLTGEGTKPERTARFLPAPRSLVARMLPSCCLAHHAPCLSVFVVMKA
jgi:hypothetical protein